MRPPRRHRWYPTSRSYRRSAEPLGEVNSSGLCARRLLEPVGFCLASPHRGPPCVRVSSLSAGFYTRSATPPDHKMAAALETVCYRLCYRCYLSCVPTKPENCREQPCRMRRPGIEPGLLAWEANVLPLDHRRAHFVRAPRLAIPAESLTTGARHSVCIPESTSVALQRSASGRRRWTRRRSGVDVRSKMSPR